MANTPYNAGKLDGEGETVGSEEGSRKRFSPWPMIGILSVLIPALLIAFLGWRAESERERQSEMRLAGAGPERVTRAFFTALADGHQDLAREALDPLHSGGVPLDDPGFRGLQRLNVTPAAAEPSAEPSAGAGTGMPRASYIAEFVTVRPWEGGGGPGPQKRRVDLEKRDGRWLIVRVAPVE